MSKEEFNGVGLTNLTNDVNLVNAIQYVDGEDESTTVSEETTEPNGLVKAIVYVPEDDNKKYLILITGETYDNENIEYRSWELIESRQATYDWIRETLIKSPEEIGYNFDVMKSKILVDSKNVAVSEAISVYRFMLLMKTEDKVQDESTFDIEEYYYDEEGNDEEDEY